MRCGATGSAADVDEGRAGLRRAAAQGAGRGSDRDLADRLPAWRAGRRDRRPPLRADGSTQPGAADARRAGPRRLRQRRGLGPVAGAGVAPTWTAGSRPDRGRHGSTSSGWTPRSCASTPALRAGRHREVLGEAQARVAEAPLRERRWALLALAQYQAGRQGEALRTLAPGAHGAPPGARRRPRTRPRRAGAGDPAPGPLAGRRGALPEPSADLPLPGSGALRRRRRRGVLRPRRRGRGRACAGCAAAGVLAVVGPSGSGKSSLVRAGRRRRAAARRPAGSSSSRRATRPLDALLGAARVGSRCRCWWSTSARRPSRCATTRPSEQRSSPRWPSTPSAGPLVVALRADRLGELSAYPGFARLVERGLYLLGAMSEADLRGRDRRTRPGRPGCCSSPAWSTCWCARSRANPAPCRCCRTRCARPGSGGEGRTLTVDGYQPVRRDPRRGRPVRRARSTSASTR